MSVYSGFATRKQENYYNQVLFKSIQWLTSLAVRYVAKEFGNFDGWINKINNEDSEICKVNENKSTEFDDSFHYKGNI